MKMGAFANNTLNNRYAWIKPDSSRESWEEVAERVATNVMRATREKESDVKRVIQLISEQKFMPGGRYLAASGREYHQTQNCLLFRAEDTREGWADLIQKTTLGLMTGAGIGVDYSPLRERGAFLKRTGGVSSGPIALAQMINEAGRGAQQGGHRRAAIWAGLLWSHPDIADFIALKDWIPEVRALKEKDFSFPATMDFTNISVILDDEFFDAYHNVAHAKHELAHVVYWTTVKRMLKTGEPGFSINVGKNAGESLRNACTEISSCDDSDICNLGSINLANIDSVFELDEVVYYGTMFLLAGTVYSDVPFAKVAQVREKNRRLGLGLMGVHEWMLKRDQKYGVSDELRASLLTYASSSIYAKDLAEQRGLSIPIKTRGIAPTGTIGIVAGTTSGIEPIYCNSYKRRYIENGEWKYQYVVDPTARKLVEMGISPDKIEDAYSLADDVERRVATQAAIQQYVDHGISSTINLPKWGSEKNNSDTVKGFGDMLIKYLPKLRGITVYPDGARSGQPLTPVSYKEAINAEGEVFEESADVCDIRGGSCGA